MAVAARRRRKQQQTIAHRNGQAMKQQPVRELIGRSGLYDAQLSVYRNRMAVTTVDATIPNYEFWDRLRRGKQPGYSLGGLFCKRIENIFASWTLGRGVTVTLAESGNPDNENDPRNYTDGLIADFTNNNHTRLLCVEQDKLGLGDQYIIVNMDGTLSIPSPDTVSKLYDPLDYRTAIAVRVTTKLEKYTIIDEYRADERIVTIQQANKPDQVTRFQNLIDRIPVIHLTNGQSGNELYGHPIHDELKVLYDEYDNIIFKQLDGARLLGNPLFAITGLEDLAAVENINQPSLTDTYYDKDGIITNRPQIKIDSNAALLIGKGGDAKFVAPPTGFTADTQQALKSLFLLLLDHTGIPEFIWGNELSSSRSSAEVQMTQWVRDIESRRKHDEVWIRELCEIWLAVTALTDSRVVVDLLEITWPALVEEDEATRLTYVQYAHDSGLLTRKTTLEILDLVENPQEEVNDAQDEADARQQALFPDGIPTDNQGQPNQNAASSYDQSVQQMDGLLIFDAIRELRDALLEL